MLLVTSSVGNGTGKPKRPWHVFPLVSSVAATPLQAHGLAMRPWPRTWCNSVSSRNVLPEPPGPSMKNIPPSPASSAATTAWKTVAWSGRSRSRWATAC
eukprot:16443249-Heterocapsa_arctica.AAC.1